MNTHDLTQQGQSGLTILSRHSVRPFRETSSHATRHVTLVYSRLCSLSHCGLPELISTKNYLKKYENKNNKKTNKLKNKSAGEELLVKPSPQILICGEKVTTTIARQVLRCLFLQ